MMDIKYRLEIDGIFQFCLGMVCGDSLYKIDLLFFNTANYNVGVSDING